LGRVSSTVEYPNAAEARAHLKDLLDAAADGVPSRLRRDTQRIAFVDAERLRHFLARLVTEAEVVPEAGGWSVFIPGASVAADGATFDEAIEETVDALREYAEDWTDHLRLAPNHREHWGLVQLVSLCDDGQLTEWLTGAGASG
jgi:predicted RNase H-like HicB family nuclease